MYRREALGLVAGGVAGSLDCRFAPASATTPADGEDAGTSTDSTEAAASADFSPLASLPVEGAREAVVGPDGATVFLAVDDGFAIVDVSDPAAPRLVAERRRLLDDGGGEPMREVQDVAVDGDRLLVVGPAHPGSGGPKAAILYDVGDPAEPRRLAVHLTDYPIHNGTLQGGRAYLTANDGGANPLAIVEVEPGTGANGGATPPTRVLGTWSPADADGAWADVPSALRPIHDVIVRGDVAYCSYWDAGTWLVDVGDPAAPRALGSVGERSPDELADVEDVDRESTELPGNHHSASVDRSGSLLAVGHEAWDEDGDGESAPGGIDLVDVSTPGEPRVRSTIDPPDTDDPSRDGVWTTAHNFELRDGVLYSAWYQSGVRVHDVSDPGSPREVAAWRDPEAARFWTAQLAGGAVEAAVVASSASVRGDDDVESGLYTFPVPAQVESPTRRRITATPGMPGFGAAAALAGTGLGALLARARRSG